MKPPEANLDTVLKQSFAGERTPPDWHPDPAELAGYHEDRLPTEMDEKIRDHLVVCQECSELLLELDGLSTLTSESGTQAPDVVDFQASTAWRRQRSLLAEERLLGAPRISAVRRLQALAAILTAAVVGLSFAWAASERALTKLRAPQSGFPIISLEPMGLVRGFNLSSASLPQDSQSWVLILNLIEIPDSAEFRLEVLTEDGQIAWAEEQLRITSEGYFSFILERDLLPPGNYRIELQAERQGVSETIAEYTLTLEEP